MLSQVSLDCIEQLLYCSEVLITTGLDTTATELSVIESVFRIGEGMGPDAINTTHREAMVESFY